MELLTLTSVLGFLGLILLGTVVAALTIFRRVVPTNEVHVVQSARKTRSYGRDKPGGNTYYAWPAFVPFLGITHIPLQVSVFALPLNDYEAYDKERLPFVVDVVAFFRVSESDIAAERVSSFNELKTQLTYIVQGAIRTVLASSTIEEIMQGRSTFGEQFTKEVDGQLQNWGVQTVKSIELMDLRDSKTSKVIHNIMEKKKSHIEMQSRVEVAENNRKAKEAEVAAKQEVDLKEQDAKQAVGLRTVEANQKVELAEQAKSQLVKEQEKLTKEREMGVIEMQQTRQADIDRQTKKMQAETDLEVKKKEAEGVRVTGQAQADNTRAVGAAEAENKKLLELAPVEAQISLAKEIGKNNEYQNYLLSIRRIEADEQIGMHQAAALEKAEVKIIANSASASEGLGSIGELLSSRGGQKVGAFLAGLGQTTDQVGKVAEKASSALNGSSNLQ